MRENEFSDAFSDDFDAPDPVAKGFLNCITVDWSCDPEFAEELDADVRARAEGLASMALQRLTAYQVGNCPITVRPCVASCWGGPKTWVTAGSVGGTPWYPYIYEGQWYNACGCAVDDCSCTALTEVYLPGPVGAIRAVVLNGVVLAPEHYRVDNYNRLVRLGGPEWPSCQDMSADPYQPGSEAFAVVYVRGVDADAMTSFVAGILAKEYANACSGNECRLPPSVVSLVRQGVSMEFGKDVFPNGRTGIDEVDVLVQYWNPYGVKHPTTIHSPDNRPPRMTTWEA